MPNKIHFKPGAIFARLTFLEDAPSRPMGRSGKLRTQAIFRCVCGTVANLSAGDVRKGHTRSCGCLEVESRHTNNRTHGDTDRRHVATEYQTWAGIKARCNRPTSISYPNYGGRGIRICDKWANSYSAFLADVGRKPTPLHTIDRIDVNGNYEPGNVRWATRKEQRRNCRSDQLIRDLTEENQRLREIIDGMQKEAA